MKQGKKLIILAVVLVVLIAASVVLYSILIEKYSFNDDGPERLENVTLSAPDFTVLNADGKEVSLSDYAGYPIVVNFWATWCSPCKTELVWFNEICKEYEDDVIFMMVNLTDGQRETIDGVVDFMLKNNYDFPVYYDTEFSGALAYGTYSIPVTVFINRDGTISSSHVGTISEEMLVDNIKEIIG